MLGDLHIPVEFELRVPVGTALRYLADRIERGERLLGEARSVDELRRAAQRWHDENLAVIESVLTDLSEASVTPVGARESFTSSLDEQRALEDDISREVGQLSRLHLRLSISSEYETAGGGSPGSSLDPADPFSPTVAGSAPSSYPTREAGPERSPTTAPETSEDGPRDDEPSAVAVADDLGGGGDEDRGGEAFVYADAATAALPGYDADAGHLEDLVGVKDVVDAFAYLITSRQMQPPLAVGLFGHWGSGKTFFLRSLQQRIDELTRGARQSGRPQAEIGVFKRVAQIEFNAWHYVEGNLWASLVDHIFANLRTSSHEGEPELERRRKTITAQLASTEAERRSLRSQIDRLERRRDDAVERTQQLAREQAEKLEKVSRIQLGDVASAATLRPGDWDLVSDALREVGAEAASSTDASVHRSAADAARSLSDARDVLQRGSVLVGPGRKRGWLWTLLLVGATAVGPGLALVLQQLDASVVTQVLTGVAGFLSAAAVVVNRGTRWATTALDKIEGAQRRVEARITDESERQAKRLATMRQEIDSLDREIQEALRRQRDADAQIRTLSDQLDELTPGRLLAGFLEERSQSTDYRKFLGVTSLVRRDFEKLSELVAQNNRAILAGGSGSGDRSGADFNRVVLYVDDLDRCPPARVVEVLQAVHLLMSFPVFVVVVAVDPRWLAQSLEFQYRRLLRGSAPWPRSRRDGTATPQDYLEKIFQIPFSVGPLDLTTREKFITGLLGREVVPASSTREEGAHDVGRPPLHPPPVSVDGASKDVAQELDVGTASGSAAAREAGTVASVVALDDVKEAEPVRAGVSVDLNPESLRFTEPELEFLRRLLPLLDTSPRSLKRYVNVYRLIKSVGRFAPRQGGDDTGPEPYQQAMFVLAVQTGLPVRGPSLLAHLADLAAQTPVGGHEPLVHEALTRFADQESDRLDSSDDWARLSAWLTANASVAGWSVAPLGPYIRHVSLYGFG